MTELQKFSNRLTSEREVYLKIISEELCRFEEHFTCEDEKKNFDEWIVKYLDTNVRYKAPEMIFLNLNEIFSWLANNLEPTDNNKYLVDTIYGQIICPAIQNRI